MSLFGEGECSYGSLQGLGSINNLTFVMMRMTEWFI